MKLLDLIQRKPHPEPWEEGDNIPWNEPGFSERMLHEHLSQEHDSASRRFDLIDQQVDWIHRHVLSGQPSRILDLGCGPGLYTSRLAQLGHSCVGIDWSPASIRYASHFAEQQSLDCSYYEGDVRQVWFGENYDLILFVFGEFNVFKPSDASLILKKVQRALKPAGTLLLEVHTFAAMQQIGLASPSWYSTMSGLFSPQPHLVLEEGFWEPERQTVTRRFFILDEASLQISRFAASYQAYTDNEYRFILQSHDFEQVTFYPSLVGVQSESQMNLEVVTAVKVSEEQQP